MADLKRITNIIGAGTYGHHMLPRVRIHCDDLGATDTILTQGRLELNRATAHEATDYGRDGVVDVTPLPRNVAQALGHAGSDEIAELNREHWEALCHRLVENIVAAQMRLNLTDGQTAWIQGFATGHQAPAVTMLRELKNRIKGQFITAFTTLPEDVSKRDGLRERPDMFVGLKDDGTLETTIMTDNASPFAASYRLETQDAFFARSIAGLLAAQTHMSKNLSLAEVGRALGHYGALCGMAFCSRSIPLGQVVWWWRGLQRLRPELPERGSSSISQIVLEGIEAVKHAISQPTARAIDEDIDLDKPMYILFIVPIPLGSLRMWNVFASEIRRWLREAYPNATPIFVSGNGAPDPRFSASYWVQATVIFPVPDVPRPIQRIIDSPSLKRRNPKSGFGHTGVHPEWSVRGTSPLSCSRS